MKRISLKHHFVKTFLSELKDKLLDKKLTKLNVLGLGTFRIYKYKLTKKRVENLKKATNKNSKKINLKTIISPKEINCLSFKPSLKLKNLINRKGVT